jgi:3',5'-cyclic AMP phosphodiesterase CpdA
LLVAVGVSLYIFTNAYGAVASAERLTVLDPAKGFPLRTGADGTSTFRVALSSDPHYGREASNAEARSAILRLSQAEYKAGRLDAFFNIGDTVEMGMEAGDWKEAIESIRKDAPSLPFATLLGNHDALIGGVTRWRAAFAGGTGRNGVPEGGLTASSWRMDAGNVHFIALDLLWGPEGFGAKEKAWLAGQLAAIPADDFIVVLSHSFFYSSGYIDEGSGKAWYDHEELLREVAPLIAGKVDLVVSGHNHYMEWIETDGTVWAVVGAMGGKPDPVPTYMSPGSVWFSQGRFGRLVLELTATGLSAEFQDHQGASLFQRTITK